MKKERSYEDLRRVMRSLIADQNNTLTNIGKISINSVANKYGFHNNENIVNTKLMESFLGSEKYEIAREMYKAKEDYDGYSDKYKKAHGIKDPKSPIDYLNLRSMFHFYNYRKLVIKNSKLKDEDGVRVYKDLDKLLAATREEFYKKSDESNMFLKQNEIGFDLKPIRSYQTISSLSKKQKEGKNPVEISELTPVDLTLKKQVLDYLLDETKEKCNLDEETYNNMKGYFYSGFVSVIKKKGYAKPVESAKLKEIIGNFTGDLNFRTVYNNKKQIEDVENLESKESIMLSSEEYTLFNKDGKYYYTNDPEMEYTGIVYGEDGSVLDDNISSDDFDFEQ